MTHELSPSPSLSDFYFEMDDLSPPRHSDLYRAKRHRRVSLSPDPVTSSSNVPLLPEIPASYLLGARSSIHRIPPSSSTLPRPIAKKLRGRDYHSDDDSASPSASPSSPSLPFHLRATSSKMRIPPVCEKFLQRLKPKPRTSSGLSICYSPPVYREGKRRMRSTPSFSDDETSGYSSGYDSFCNESPL